jgi:hypothetical protein
MPLTNKGKKIMKSMKGQYGKKEGEKVFYASRNKGTIKGVERANKGKLIRGKNKKPDFIIMIALAEKKKKKNNKKG